MIDQAKFNALKEIFGDRLQENVRMANFATMNVGGPADAILIATSADELATMVGKVWELDLPIKVLGSGSNLLVSDKGIRASCGHQPRPQYPRQSQEYPHYREG